MTQNEQLTKKLTEYYNKFNEDKRLKSRHGQVEYRITMKYVRKYLECIGKQARILDVGAGTGAYSIPLAAEGYEVHALELVKHNVQRLRAASDEVHALQGNALKLSKKFEKEYFDLVLVFGPMYHLFTHDDRMRVIEEVKKVLKPDGIVMIAYCMNDYAVIKHGFMEGTIRDAVASNKINDSFNVVPDEDNLYDYVTLEEIDRLMVQSGLNRKEIFTPDGPTNYMRQFLRDMDDESFELFVRYVESISKRRDMLGVSAHLVDVLGNKTSDKDID